VLAVEKELLAVPLSSLVPDGQPASLEKVSRGVVQVCVSQGLLEAVVKWSVRGCHDVVPALDAMLFVVQGPGGQEVVSDSLMRFFEYV
jgi:hypothetical protein